MLSVSRLFTFQSSCTNEPISTVRMPGHTSRKSWLMAEGVPNRKLAMESPVLPVLLGSEVNVGPQQYGQNRRFHGQLPVGYALRHQPGFPARVARHSHRRDRLVCAGRLEGE